MFLFQLVPSPDFDGSLGPYDVAGNGWGGFVSGIFIPRHPAGYYAHVIDFARIKAVSSLL